MDAIAPAPIPPPEPPDNSKKLLTASLLVSWLGCLVWPLLVVVELIIFAGLSTRKSKLAKWCILGSFEFAFVCLAVVVASVSYFTGSAGPVFSSAHSLGDYDTGLRCKTQHWGDMLIPVLFLYIVPHDFTLTALGAVFGPVPHTYHGPLPTPYEAMTAVLEAKCKLTPDQIHSRVWQVGQHQISYTEPSTEDLFVYQPYTPPSFHIYRMKLGAEISAGVFEDSCLILMVPEEGGDTITSLIDVATGKLITQFLWEDEARSWER